MECSNLFCIHWQKDHCTLSEISLDILGGCEECVYIDLDSNILWGLC